MFSKYCTVHGESTGLAPRFCSDDLGVSMGANGTPEPVSASASGSPFLITFVLRHVVNRFLFLRDVRNPFRRTACEAA